MAFVSTGKAATTAGTKGTKAVNGHSNFASYGMPLSITVCSGDGAIVGVKVTYPQGKATTIGTTQGAKVTCKSKSVPSSATKGGKCEYFTKMEYVVTKGVITYLRFDTQGGGYVSAGIKTKNVVIVSGQTAFIASLSGTTKKNKAGKEVLSSISPQFGSYMPYRQYQKGLTSATVLSTPAMPESRKIGKVGSKLGVTKSKFDPTIFLTKG